VPFPVQFVKCIIPKKIGTRKAEPSPSKRAVSHSLGHKRRIMTSRRR
jgi:hypothetical protein